MTDTSPLVTTPRESTFYNQTKLTSASTLESLLPKSLETAML